ncbi:MAG: DKNYY domain-containing protein [Patescibacteria group bacterium]
MIKNTKKNLTTKLYILLLILLLFSLSAALAEECGPGSQTECVVPIKIIGENLGDGYSKDEKFVYFKNSKIEDADQRTFEVLGVGYAKDNKNAYFYGQEITIFNIATFTFLKKGYARDKGSIYYQGVNITKFGGVDPNTFGIIPHAYWDYYIKDKDRVYCTSLVNYTNPEGIIVVKNAEINTFEIVNNTYSKDANHVFSNWHNKEIPNADPNNFNFNDRSSLEIFNQATNDITTDFIDNKDHPCASAYGDQMAKTNCYLKAAIESNNLDNCAGLGESWFDPCIAGILKNEDIKEISFCDSASNQKARDECMANFEFFKTLEARKEIYDPAKSTGRSTSDYIGACGQSGESHRCLLRLALDKKEKTVCESIDNSNEKFNYFGISTSYRKACFLYFNPVLNIDRLVFIYFILAAVFIAVVFILFNKNKRGFKFFIHDLLLGLIFESFVILFIVYPARVFSSSSFYPLRDYTSSFFNALVKYYKNGGISYVDFMINQAMYRWWPVLFIFFPVLGYLWRKNKIIFWVLLFIIIAVMAASVIIPIASMT